VGANKNIAFLPDKFGHAFSISAGVHLGREQLRLLPAAPDAASDGQ